ncbi:a-factor receptor [Xanthoria calcicola]
MASTPDSLTSASVALPTLAVIALALNIPPLIWHSKNRNIAACNLIVWTIFLNLCNLINAIIWPTDNVYNWSTGFVLCDIEVKLRLAATFGIPGSLACIMRALAKVLDTERTILVPTMKQRRLETIITALLCFGGPVYAIGIHYVVQPSRYYIMAISGCTVSLDRSWPTMALVVIWPVILCLAATYYGIVVMIRMRKYRREFSSILTASSSSLTKSRFLRLFLLSSSLVLIFLPLQLYILFLNTSAELIPYSWDLIHNRHAWMDIIMVPTHGFVSIDRWISVVLGIFIFLFFGLGSDATKMYRKWWIKLRLGTNFPGLYGQASTLQSQNPNTDRAKGSLASAFVVFCRTTLFRRRVSTNSSEKDVTSTILSSPTSSFAAEKYVRNQNPASITAPTHIIQSTTTSSQDRPLPPVPAHSRASSFKQYFTRVRDFAPSHDIESALQRHEDHRPNRYIAGLWHANNAGVPAVHGACMGNVNGLRY